MKTAKRRKKTTLFHKIEPVLYLAPAFIVLGIFVYFPFFKTIIESFFLLNSMGEVREFIGFENYINIFSNSKFIQSIFNSIKFAIFTVPFTVGLSFILAMMAAKKRPASPIYETLFSLPMALSTSVAAMIFELMFSPTLGIVNSITGLNIKWLSDRNTAMWVLIVIQVWMNLGYNFLFILAAIRGMSKEVTESARRCKCMAAGRIHCNATDLTNLVLPALQFSGEDAYDVKPYIDPDTGRTSGKHRDYDLLYV